MRGVNRKAVKRFFEWSPPRRLGKLGLALALLGLLALGLAYELPSAIFDFQTHRDIDRLLATVYAAVGGSDVFTLLAIAAVVGGGYLAYRYLLTRPKIPTKFYRALLEAKQRDIGGVLERSYRKIGVDIDDLLDFDAEDITDLTLKSPTGTGDAFLGALQRKSVILIGSTRSSEYGRPIIVNKKILYECSPILVWILYLTRDQLLTYKAVVDITRGDLNDEAVDRVFLRYVVQIGTNTKSDRIKEASEPYLFQQFKVTRGYKPKEIVKRQHTITVTMADGRGKELPLGAQEIEDGGRGRLGKDSGDDDSRYERVAQQIWKRINETKVT